MRLRHAIATSNWSPPEVSAHRVGIVVALPAESRSLYGRALRVGERHVLRAQALLAVSGVGERRAEQAAQALVDAGVSGLMSWGCAGGLNPTLQAGALCLPESIVTTEGHRWVTDQHWRHAMAQALDKRALFHGALAHAPQVMSCSAAKHELATSTGAVATDMESAAVARVAHRHGLPLLVVRSVVDPLRLSLPALVVDHVDESGRVPLMPLLSGLLRRPSDVWPLLRLASGFRAAMTTLRAVTACAGDDLLLTQALSQQRTVDDRHRAELHPGASSGH